MKKGGKVLVRFGYVAMSVNLVNASPSKTMTLKQFEKIPDRDAAIRKLERIAQQNLENTIRLMKYNKGERIFFYRFSSRLIPLVGHELVEGWDYLTPLKEQLIEIGTLAKEGNIRVGFHPDHYTLLNSTKENVFEQSVAIIKRHVELISKMGINPRHRNVLHIGGKAGGKEKALQRFITNFPLMPEELRYSIILENDDKTFNAKDTLFLAEKLGIPMVLDVHHERCNPSEEPLSELWPRILKTWEASYLPPKIHISSSKDQKDIRAHADYIKMEDFLPFLMEMKETTSELDVMIEAKQKDNALFKLMKELKNKPGVQVLDKSVIQIL